VYITNDLDVLVRVRRQHTERVALSMACGLVNENRDSLTTLHISLFHSLSQGSPTTRANGEAPTTALIFTSIVM